MYRENGLTKYAHDILPTANSPRRILPLRQRALGLLEDLYRGFVHGIHHITEVMQSGPGK